MDALTAYELIRSQLLLPEPILDVVESAFQELGYPLEKDSTTDWNLNPFDFYKAESQGKKIILLHIAGEVISDPSQVLTISNIADVFLGKTDGLFFFAPIKELNKAFNGLFAASFVKRPSGPARVKFFDQGDIDDLKAKALAQRKVLIVFLLDVEKLLPPANNGSPAKPPPNVAEIADRVQELLLERLGTLGSESGEFFRSVRDALSWPEGWLQLWEPKGTPRDSARSLVLFLIRQRTYPSSSNRQGYTTLGVLLENLMPDVGGDTADEMYQIVEKYRLIEKPDVLEDLKKRFCKKV
jgi:hypothetical protein